MGCETKLFAKQHRSSLSHLPLPIPAFDSTHPLKISETDNKYYQPSSCDILFRIKNRYNSQRCCEARAKVSSRVVFSPPLREDPVDRSMVTTYHVDAVGIPFITLSVGAPAISAGLGAAFPSCDYLHIECWSHLHPLTIKNLFNNSNTLSFSIPDSAIGNIADGHQRNIMKSKLKKKVIDFIVYNLNLARNSISSALADILMENLCDMIKDGTGSRSPRISLQELSKKIENRYSRITENGLFGVWRRSDVCDMSFDHFDSNGKITSP